MRVGFAGDGMQGYCAVDPLDERELEFAASLNSYGAFISLFDFCMRSLDYTSNSSIPAVFFSL